MTTPSSNRVQCSICGNSIRLTKEGRLADHDRNRATMIDKPGRCAGSGRVPDAKF